MAAEWFRSRSQRNSIQGLTTWDCNTGLSLHDSNNPTTRRSRSTFCVSSILNFQSPPSLQRGEKIMKVQNPDNTYCKPSESQMVETLKVVMMSRGMMEPLPIEYNSCITHLLEAYYEACKRLLDKDDEIARWTKQHERDTRYIEELKSEWEELEAYLRADLKKLRIDLCEFDGGMGQVMLTRETSMACRTRELGNGSPLCGNLAKKQFPKVILKDSYR